MSKHLSSHKFDEEEFQAQDLVRTAFMDSPKAKKLVKEAKKELKKNKAKIVRKINKKK